jgi:hypothetical protein
MATQRPSRMQSSRAMWRMREIAAYLRSPTKRVTQIYTQGKPREPDQVDRIGPLRKPATIEGWAEREW